METEYYVQNLDNHLNLVMFIRNSLLGISRVYQETKVWDKGSHEQCNCQLYCQFSLANVCDRESLCDIRRDYSHHFEENQARLTGNSTRCVKTF